VSETNPQVLGMCERCFFPTAQTKQVTCFTVNQGTVEKDALLVDMKSARSFQ